MINLLPPELKEAYTYAQRNSKLMHWVISFAFALAGLLVISLGGILYVYQTSHSYDNQISQLQDTLKQEKLTETEKQASDISSSLKLSVKVLSKEVLFSKLLKQLAAVTPSNANLTDLNISQTQGGLDISAEATDYKAATQLQVNLSDAKNQIFSKADIISITCGGTTENGDNRYPCTVVIRALFAKDNPFLFISNTTGKTKS